MPKEQRITQLQNFILFIYTHQISQEKKKKQHGAFLKMKNTSTGIRSGC
jgi:hypothetical protein